uniref:Immunoglobulin domain-containing protein n=1 Tax=Pelusios castaneus TaxID=367368 RepID=A0A8C8VPC2_9SAUR
TQTEGSVIISQGDPVLLNCTYQISGAPVPFWYVQYPNAVLRLFLRDIGRVNSDEGIRKGFNATHEKKSQSFHLWKPSSDLSDSATYYCAVSDTVRGRAGEYVSVLFLCKVALNLLNLYGAVTFLL